MPHYFFDLRGDEPSVDEDGTELPNLSAARVEAVQFAGNYLYDHPGMVWDGHEVRVVVRESGRVVFTVVTLAIDCG